MNLLEVKNNELPRGRLAAAPMVMLSNNLFYFNTMAVEKYFKKSPWVQISYKDGKLYLIPENKATPSAFRIGLYMATGGKKFFGQLAVRRILHRLGITIEKRKQVSLSETYFTINSKKTLAIIVPLS